MEGCHRRRTRPHHCDAVWLEDRPPLALCHSRRRGCAVDCNLTRADIWWNPDIPGTRFFSDRLNKAPACSKVDGPFSLRHFRMVEVSR